MLIIALIAAVCLYVGLYMGYGMIQSHLSAPAALTAMFNDLLKMPNELIFFLLRGLILCVFFYVIADFLVSTARRNRKRHADNQAAPVQTPAKTPAKTHASWRRSKPE